MPPSSENTAAVIVAFHDPPAVARCLQAIAGQVAHVFVVDNSTDAVLSFPDPGTAGVTLLQNRENRGLGAALNQGLVAGRTAGFSWTLLLDQDSRVESGFLEAMHQALIHLDQRTQARVGLITPTIFDASSAAHLPAIRTGLLRNCKVYPGDGDQFVDFRITSGSLLRNRVTERIGLMDEAFFIDYIDYDYCFRLRRAGQLILLAHRAQLHHALGETHKQLFGLPVVEHSPARIYYQTRNRLEIIRRYGLLHPSVAFSELCRMVLKPWKILLCEEQKGEKLRYFCRGLGDFFRRSEASQRIS